MRLTTKARYAVTAMLDLALHSNQGPVSAADISRRQTISRSYLEQLFGKLRQEHLVASVHGPGGGYFIARKLDEISIADIIQAVDEAIDATQCRGKLDCHDGERCMTHQLWADLNAQIESYLASVSLSQLAAHQRQRDEDVHPVALLPSRRPNGLDECADSAATIGK